ncbi:gastrula zinc finger protein XlCGF26.1-like isoform X1 [Centruroides vittatus]|uniref:gastrula zinc finger protein XlCGF26.1-like isoform X1 n=2 Tax=Centruroides vittatus TaxID=120091 RepID=UPI00350FF261
MNGNKKDNKFDFNSASTSQNSSIVSENSQNSSKVVENEKEKTESKEISPNTDNDAKEKKSNPVKIENNNDKEEHMVVEVMPEACVLSEEVPKNERPTSSKMLKTSEGSLFVGSSFPTVGLDLRKTVSREEYALFFKNQLASLYGYINPMENNQAKALPTITKTVQQVKCMCYKCKMQFVSVEDLAKHCQVHRVEGDRMLNRCHMCPYGTNRTYDFRRHLKTHLRQKGHRCLRCGGVFKTKKEANDHPCIQTVTNTQPQNNTMQELFNKKPVVSAEQQNLDLSEQMLSLFSNANNLQQYLLKLSEIKEQNSAEKTYSCDKCDRVFTTPSALTHHSRNHWNETKEKKYKCHFCSYVTTSSSNLSSHMETHIEEKPQTCLLCGKIFTNSATLKHHMEFHSTDCPHTCGICGKNFKDPNSLNAHILQQHVKDNFVCPQCGKSFANIRELYKHEEVHNSQKVYKCPYCELSFSESGSFQNHVVNTHTQDLNHKHKICDKPILFPTNLQDQLRILQKEKK